MFLLSRFEFALVLSALLCTMTFLQFFFHFRPAKTAAEPTISHGSEAAGLPLVKRFDARRNLSYSHAFYETKFFELTIQANFVYAHCFDIPKSSPRFFLVRFQLNVQRLSISVDEGAMKSRERHIALLTELVLFQLEFSEHLLLEDLFEGPVEVLDSFR